MGEPCEKAYVALRPMLFSTFNKHKNSLSDFASKAEVMLTLKQRGKAGQKKVVVYLSLLT